MLAGAGKEEGGCLGKEPPGLALPFREASGLCGRDHRPSGQE